MKLNNSRIKSELYEIVKSSADVLNLLQKLCHYISNYALSTEELQFQIIFIMLTLNL